MVWTVFASTTMFYWIKIKETILLIKANRDLTHTIKAILKVFPEGVLIRSLDETAKKVVNAYTNNAAESIFDQDLHKMSIKEIEINSKKVGKFAEEEINSKMLNMEEFLKQQELKLDNSQDCTIVWQQLIELKYYCENFEEFKQPKREESKQENIQHLDEQKVDLYYSVKTIKVNWIDNKHSYLHVFIDTTKIKKLEEERANTEYQQSMFTNLSHDMRTPLNAITNSLQLSKLIIKEMIDKIAHIQKANFLCQPLFVKFERFIQIGEISSWLLLNLIEDILDMAKFKANMFKLTISEFKLSSLLTEIDFLFAFQWIERNLQFKIVWDQYIFNNIYESDSKRIKQILINLLSNSIKFTERGSIIVNVNKFEQEGETYLEFIIRDTGIGISEDDIPQLFRYRSYKKLELQLKMKI